MQFSDYEKLVEASLLIRRDTLIAPQYLIRVNGRDHYPDVLAVRPKEKIFYLVEVTVSPDARVLLPKLRDYHEHGDWVAARLAEDFGFEGVKWSLMPWVFIRREAEAHFKTMLEAAGLRWGEDLKHAFLDELVARREKNETAMDETRWGPLSNWPEPGSEDAAPGHKS